MDRGRHDLVELLRQTQLFADLPDAALTQLADAAVLRRWPAGAWVFRQGEAASSVFVVVSGRLETIIEKPPPERVLRVLGQGEVVGEIAFITGLPRSASVRARRDTELLEIPYRGLRDLVRRHTDVAVRLMHVLASRLADGPPPTGSAPPRTVAVVDLRGAADATILTGISDAFGGSVTSVELAAVPLGSTPGRLLDELEQRHDAVLLPVAVADPPDWLDFCFRQSDRVVCVADAAEDPPSGQLAERLAGCDLALTGSPCGHTASWLDALRPRAHHWLDRPGRAAGVARMVRRLSGRSRGLVLSGGGARGFAHIGVLQRLHDLDITIDRIGGCSMGAFIAALAATGRPASEMVEVCREEFVRQNPFNDYTVPRVSVIRARKAAAMLDRVFEDVAIEDCVMGFFCVSCDLASAELVVHRRGRLAEAVGASMSIPGFAPPISTDDGRLLVDGAVLDNLPVGVMTAAGEGPVLASDVMANDRLGRSGALPSLLETLTRVTMLASWQRRAETAELADHVITPDVQAIGLLDFRRLDTAVAAGQRAVSAAAESGW